VVGSAKVADSRFLPLAIFRIKIQQRRFGRAICGNPAVWHASFSSAGGGPCLQQVSPNPELGAAGWTVFHGA
jgi:hypothetical protein